MNMQTFISWVYAGPVRAKIRFRDIEKRYNMVIRGRSRYIDMWELGNILPF